MRLSEIITPEAVIPKLRATDRDEAILEIVDHLVEQKRISEQQKDDLVVEFLKREALGTTAIGHGVAIPHVKTDKLKEFMGALAISRSGVEFSYDEPPVNVIFLFLSPARAVSGHLKLLAHIGGILRHENYVKLLKDAQTREELVDLVKDAERMIFGEGGGGGDDKDKDRVPA
ncbi:PTS sugar transporter subunit IIA [bacterium]|nr:PTS sugar transporter subunit IIA [bacterium]